MEGTEKLYTVKEMFYSLQGEGYHAGRPAVFIRFTGCNLKCPFCDTDFKDGEKMTGSEMLERTKELGGACRFVVFTGGEPTLQLDRPLIDAFRRSGYYLAMETNGTKPYPTGLDWITVSPKCDFCGGSNLWMGNYIAAEVKVVYTGENAPEKYGFAGELKYIQPCDTGDPQKNKEIISRCVDWLKEHPDWRLSLQTQKIIGVL